ncbi:hypothetical protein C1H46_008870 [Malus baccata]|uniref:4Fe-4S ferredoxin-type domain-containing protein n=1 Tax=Malus baccata TaxID=106549 RepID=A0A540N3C2_MALBA|nr:hypothetical protein C1H46_008870 [Malus baccata]
MAQLLSPSPVFTEALKFQNPLPNGCSRTPWRMLAKPSSSLTSIGGHGGGGRRRRGLGRLGVATDGSPSTDAVADDYYSVLGLGDNPDTTNFYIFISEVYEVFSDPVQRMVYDEIHGYALTPINPFLDDSASRDHAFVDEFSCIGCKNCASVAPDVFGIEEDFGRARVPVDCIHWTSAAQLSLLKDEMRRVERVNVALMLAGMGSSVDVFRMEQAKIRMMKKRDTDKTEAYWDNIWANPKEYHNSEEEVKERAKRAAAAARRWREYSRRGADKPPSYKLPEAISNNEN